MKGFISPFGEDTVIIWYKKYSLILGAKLSLSLIPILFWLIAPANSNHCDNNANDNKLDENEEIHEVVLR